MEVLRVGGGVESRGGAGGNQASNVENIDSLANQVGAEGHETFPSVFY